MIDIGVDASLFRMVSNRVELPDGKKIYAKKIYADPKEYFTVELMQKIEDYCGKEFQYGVAEDDDRITDTEELAIIDSEVE